MSVDKLNNSFISFSSGLKNSTVVEYNIVKYKNGEEYWIRDESFIKKANFSCFKCFRDIVY